VCWRDVMIQAFIQARMSSTRFPGKVLAPMNGRPVIAHVIARVASAMPIDQITVATSHHQSDDPLTCYLRELGVAVYRGSLENVFCRFQMCLKERPCEWFVRVSADSPLIEPRILTDMLALADRTDLDLVTNVFPRTFPKGQSFEMIRSATFAQIDPRRLSTGHKEHVTTVYYDHPSEFNILNIDSGDPAQAQTNYCIDTIEDLRRLEMVLQESQAGSTAAETAHANKG